MPFQLEHITLAERVVLGCSCVMLAGEYGLITGLAQEYGTSRQFLQFDPGNRPAVVPAREQHRPPRLPDRSNYQEASGCLDTSSPRET